MKAQDSPGGILQFYSKWHLLLLCLTQESCGTASREPCSGQQLMTSLPRSLLRNAFLGCLAKAHSFAFGKSLVFVIIKATGIFLWEGVYVTQGRIISFIHTNENFRGKLKNLLSHHTKLGSQVFDAYSSSCLKGQIPERMAMKSKRLGFILCSLLFWFDSPV